MSRDIHSEFTVRTLFALAVGSVLVIDTHEHQTHISREMTLGHVVPPNTVTGMREQHQEITVATELACCGTY